MTRTLESILAEHDFFKGLAPEYLEFVVGCASNVRFERDEFLFHEGRQAEALYFIREGRVALELFTTQRGPVTLQTLGVGEVVGWSWLIPPYLWRSDARALERTRAIALDGTCLRHKCDEDHDLGYELMKRFAHIMEKRMQAAQMQLLDLYGHHD